MTEENAICRVMRAEELPLALDWAAAEGWNPGLGDAAAFLAADPAGFFLAELEGRPVAAISVVNHDAAFAFLGLYLCLPEHRGKGFGLALWQYALDHAGARVVGLDGVAAQQANYARSGFAPAGSSTRHCGLLAAIPHPRIRLAERGDLGAIQAMDHRANGFSRPAFIAEWATQTPLRRTVVLIDGKELLGFATIRLCREGAKIGPIIAPTPDQAMELACAALSELPAETVSIDLPDTAGAFSDMLISQGFQHGFTTARMYRGPAPRTDATLLAIATMELG